MAEDFVPYKGDIINILDSVCNPELLAPEDARDDNVEAQIDNNKLKMKGYSKV